jgi:hypothetical protein
LIVEKKRNGLANRDDILTWLDLHDVDEGGTPKFSSGTDEPLASKF